MIEKLEKKGDILQVIINFDVLDSFIKKNNFLVITDDMLKKENMYKDLKYSTTDNFLHKKIYPSDMPLIINKDVWNKLVSSNNDLKRLGLCIKILDAYRPIQVQQLFWQFYKEKEGSVNENFIANPVKYSIHNITLNAVDIIPVKLDNKAIELPCEFDDFTNKAKINYNLCSDLAKYNRDKFIEILNNNGLIVNPDEWWHFYSDSLEYLGMGYDYSKTKYVPVLEKETFKLI